MATFLGCRSDPESPFFKYPEVDRRVSGLRGLLVQGFGAVGVHG